MMSNKTENEKQTDAVSGQFERLVMRFRMCGKYSVVSIGKYYGVRRHGLFKDKLVNLELPHLLTSLKGEPYFNQALGSKEDANRIFRRLNGVEAYDA